MKKGPIGFFDSGYGGLTVLEEVRKVLPEYDYLYLGDNARAPYGTKSFQIVYEYTWQCVKELFSRGCDLVILACNTASAKALRSIQQNELVDYPGKRVLGVIRPSAENVGRMSFTKEIAVLATQGTVASNSYVLEFQKFSPEVKVHQYACPVWVPLIENNEFLTEEGRSFIRKDVNNVLRNYPNIDVIVLACTHYPILLPMLETMIPSHIKIVSQGEIVATSLKSYLQRHTWLVKKLSTKRTTLYLTTENATVFQESTESILGLKLVAQQIEIKWP
ncbi:MAG: glutamate racemase [Brumimicrobium sp.]|nr:glutamate racemase [Brumimicrobium sp.]